MGSDYVATLRAALTLVQENPSAPRVYSISLADNPSIRTPIEAQAGDCDGVFEWAQRLGSLVRITDHGTYLDVAAVCTVDDVAVTVWSHAKGTEARALLRTCGSDLAVAGSAHLNPATRELVHPFVLEALA